MVEMKDLNAWRETDDVTVPQRHVMSAGVLHVGGQTAIAFCDNGWLVIECDS